MKNNYLYRSFKFTFRVSPVSHIFVLIEEIWQALFHSIAAILLSGFIDTVIAYSQKRVESKSLLLYALSFASLYVLQELWALVYNGSMNIGMYEKPNNYANLLIAEKASRLRLIEFEDANILNMYKYAKDNIENEYVPYLVMRMIYIFCRFIEIASLTFVISKFDWQLFFVAGISVIPYFITRLIRGKEMYKYKSIQIPEERKLDYLWSLFTDKSAGKELRISRSDEYIKEKWLKKNKEVFDPFWKLKKKDAFSVLFCDMLSSIGYGIAVFICLYLALNKTISIGNFGAAIGAFTMIQFCMRNLLEALGSISMYAAHTKHFFDFLDLPEETASEFKDSVSVLKKSSAESKDSFYSLKNCIELKNVSFSYPNKDKKAIEDINLSIRKGETIALIGENGSGKTTLSKIILGLYEADEGAVLWDGTDLNFLDKDALYKNISLTLQKPVQYNFSLRENVAISDLSRINEEVKIIEALKENDADYLLEKTGGLDGRLGRIFNGAELSGGEWQRLALSRCRFKNADFLILDEPTSALDPIEESLVLKRFISLIKNKTAVIISHRAGLCRLVDRVALMKEGRLLALGTHDELFSSCEEYRKLYSAQADLYRD
ncbi:ABC transporter ATP-binding protein [Treponema denticola]|uniref:ABC transporter ATP-binding protein n=1 Tax=Treponema denticola TaxID=158 RepID=UPI0020A2AD2A|nr:ABC transporter ATP-binding protein [Treponema denticola]UTC82962.1 ABC transporter ATP-binding protein [Treponema denticola]